MRVDPAVFADGIAHAEDDDVALVALHVLDVLDKETDVLTVLFPRRFSGERGTEFGVDAAFAVEHVFYAALLFAAERNHADGIAVPAAFDQFLYKRDDFARFRFVLPVLPPAVHLNAHDGFVPDRFGHVGRNAQPVFVERLVRKVDQFAAGAAVVVRYVGAVETRHGEVEQALHFERRLHAEILVVRAAHISAHEGGGGAELLGVAGDDYVPAAYDRGQRVFNEHLAGLVEQHEVENILFQRQYGGNVLGREQPAGEESEQIFAVHVHGAPQRPERLFFGYLIKIVLAVLAALEQPLVFADEGLRAYLFGQFLLLREERSDPRLYAFEVHGQRQFGLHRVLVLGYLVIDSQRQQLAYDFFIRRIAVRSLVREFEHALFCVREVVETEVQIADLYVVRQRRPEIAERRFVALEHRADRHRPAVVRKHVFEKIIVAHEFFQRALGRVIRFADFLFLGVHHDFCDGVEREGEFARLQEIVGLGVLVRRQHLDEHLFVALVAQLVVVGEDLPGVRVRTFVEYRRARSEQLFEPCARPGQSVYGHAAL